MFSYPSFGDARVYVNTNLLIELFRLFKYGHLVK